MIATLVKEANPALWAEAQHQLGRLYYSRTLGDQMIAACDAALTVYTREAFPFDWASTQNNLAAAYQNRIRGERAENLERALTVFTREAFPFLWAWTQMCLAEAYRGRIRGERADNLGQAIGLYEAALTVYTREGLPREHLAVAYRLGQVLLETRDWARASHVLADARSTFTLLFGQGLNEHTGRLILGVRKRYPRPSSPTRPQ